MISFNPLRALPDEQVETLNEAAIGLLERTGFRVQHDALLRIAERAGARVDAAQGRVRVPRALLSQLLGQTPQAFTIHNMTGDAFEIGAGVPGIFAITNDPWIVDYESGVPRHPGLEDVRRHTMLAQVMNDVVCASCMDYPVVEDASPSSSWRALEVHLLHHAKHHVVLPASLDKFERWLDIAAILSRGRDLKNSRLFTCGVAVLSPLTLTETNGDLLLRACTLGAPVLPTICPMAGTTAPYSMASTLLVAHAENLFMAVLTQMAQPGTPFLYAMGPSWSDMRAGENRYYTLDKVLWKVAGVQLAQFCGLPCSAECGGAMSHRCDAQTGAESMLFMLAAQASRADVLAGLGSCHNANGLSAEMMVIQQEWLRAARFLVSGMPMDESSLAVASIEDAGPGGNFLTDPLTLEFARGGAFFDAGLLDYSGGYGAGLPLLERAHQHVEELAASWRPCVPDDIQEALQRHFHDRFARG